MLLHYMNVTNYENVHVGFQEFGPKKGEGHYGWWGVMPMITLPTGEKLSQTHAVVRYLSTVYKGKDGEIMYPGTSDPELSWEIDSLFEFGDDMIYTNQNFLSPLFADPSKVEELLPNWLENHWGGYWKRVNDSLASRPEGSTGIFGTGITCADMAACAHLGRFAYNSTFDRCDVHLEELKKYPHASQYAEEMKPFIMEWLAT